MSKIKVPSVTDLFKADVHLGHQIRRWNPRMEPFIYESRKGIHIINLEKTHECLQAAAEFLYAVAKEGKQIIFVGTKRQVVDLIKTEAIYCGSMYVNQRWLGGTITNYSVIKNKIDKLANMDRKRKEGEFEKYTKKERLLLDREIEKLENSVGGLSDIKGLPAVLVVVDGRREKTAVHEANMKNIPVVALVDTDTDPEGIAYPMPGNDDAIKSVSLILRTLSVAIEKGSIDFAKGVEKAKEVEKAGGKISETEKVTKDEKQEKVAGAKVETKTKSSKKVTKKADKTLPKPDKKAPEKKVKPKKKAKTPKAKK